MSLRVLEINDCGISVSDETGVLASSPGYMVVEQGSRAGKSSPLFGAAAAGMSKLHPLSSSTEFWYRPGMDPLVRPLAHFRHNADIAHAHLGMLASEAGINSQSDVLVVAPGSFSHSQLAVLLGILGQTPFRAAGLVDTAVLAADGTRTPAIFLDLHLHQVVLSQIDVAPESGGTFALSREAAVSVPSVGWVGISDTLVQLITEAFIQQCRFNPQHNARWEQSLYDSLPFWLAQEPDADNNLLMEIQTDSALHQARLTRASVTARLQPVYRRIIEHLDDLHAGLAGRTLLLSERLAALPGAQSAFTALGHPLQVVSSVSLAAAALRHQGQLLGENGAQRFVTQLQVDAQWPDAAPAVPAPTHILSGAEAWPLHRRLVLGAAVEGRVQLNGRASHPVAELESDGSNWTLRCLAAGWSLNSRPAASVEALHNGDILQLAGSEPLRLIRVQHG